jgi:hypothetical protein
MNPTNYDLKTAIQNVNELSDQKTIRELAERIGFLNINSPFNDEIFELARQKGLR